MDIFEAMNTAQAIRQFKPDPVPEETVREMIFYATCASNPQNSQLWEFIVVDEKAKKDAIGEAVSKGFKAFSSQNGVEMRTDLGAMLASSAAIVFVAARNEYPSWEPDERFVASACYPAGQNLIVAARALGIGATFTMLHGLAEETVRELLDVPGNVKLALTIPIGFPCREFGAVNRKPVEEVIHWNKF